MLEPIERNYEVSLAPFSANILDAAQILSLINKKSFRQGMEYAFDSIEIFVGTATQGNVGIYRIPFGWVSANSWVKGFSHWRKQQDEAAEEAGAEGKEAGWRDFKIYYNRGHELGTLDGVTYNSVERPLSFPSPGQVAAIDPTVNYEWFHSEVVVPNNNAIPGNTVEYTLGMMGGNVGTYAGLIHNYAMSRSRPQTPEPNTVQPSTDGGIYQDMQDVGMDVEEILSNYRNRNDEPPYYLGDQSTYEWYPYGSMAEDPSANGQQLGVLVDKLLIRSGTSAFATDATGPFSAYCGLLLLYNNTESSVTALVRHTAGSYNGVAARPMQDVN